MNKLWYYVLIPIIGIMSLLAGWGVYEWLLTIQANITLRVAVPIATFITVFLGMWLVLNLVRTFLFHQKGVAGYKLRGRITFYFLLTSFGSIVIVGGVMFYLIILIENTIIDREKSVANNIVDAYKDIIIYNKKEYEKSLEERLRFNPGSFPLSFRIVDESVRLGTARDSAAVSNLMQEEANIVSYYSRPSKRIYYPGDISSLAVIRGSGIYYADTIPDYLSNAFVNSRKNTDKLYELRFYKDFIRPISFVTIFVLSVPILLIVFFVSFFVARSISGGIEKIADGTHLVALGNLDHRVSVRTRDEIEDLADNFNEMAEKLKIASSQIKRMERLEAWKEMAKRLAHEIKNPLTPIKLSAERLQMSHGRSPEDFAAILEKTTNTIIGETKRLENLVNEFSQYARLPYPKIERHDIVPLLMETAGFIQDGYPHALIEKDFPVKSLMADFDDSQFKQVLHNLVKNGIEAQPGDNAWLKISLEQKASSLKITIADHGPGIPDNIWDHIFEPYYTTKDKGTGLGLAIAERIILEHGGYIWFDSSSQGSRFYIELPLNKTGEQHALEDSDR